MTNLVTGSDKLQRNGLVARKKARLKVEETLKRIYQGMSKASIDVKPVDKLGLNN